MFLLETIIAQLNSFQQLPEAQYYASSLEKLFSASSFDMGDADKLLEKLQRSIDKQESYDKTIGNGESVLRFDGVCYRALLVIQFQRLSHYWTEFAKLLLQDKNNKSLNLAQYDQDWEYLQNSFLCDTIYEKYENKRKIDLHLETLVKVLKTYINFAAANKIKVEQYALDDFCHDTLLLLAHFKRYGQDDSITLDGFHEIPKRYLIATIDLHQFDLRGLSKWFQKQKKDEAKNPLNQRLFHVKDLALIKMRSKQLELELDPPVVSLAQVERNIREITTFGRILDNENPYTYLVKSVLYYLYIIASLIPGLVAGFVFWFSVPLELFVDLILGMFCLLGERWPKSYRVGDCLFSSFIWAVIVCFIPALVVGIVTLPLTLPLIASVVYTRQWFKALLKKAAWVDVLELSTQRLMTVGLVLGATSLVSTLLFVFAFFLAPQSLLAGWASALGIKALATQYASMMHYVSYTLTFGDLCMILGALAFAVPVIITALVSAIFDISKVIHFARSEQSAAYANEAKFRRKFPIYRTKVLAMNIDSVRYNVYYPETVQYTTEELTIVIERHRCFVKKVQNIQQEMEDDNAIDSQNSLLNDYFEKILIEPAEQQRFAALTPEQREQEESDREIARRLARAHDEQYESVVVRESSVEPLVGESVPSHFFEDTPETLDPGLVTY